MKPLLFLALLLLASASRAQVNDIDIKKFKGDADYRNKIFKGLNIPALKSTPQLLSTQPFTTGQLNLGVNRLPLDGMPCIVPDTKDIAAMPNAWKGKVAVPFTGNPPRIPNPSSTVPLQHYKSLPLPDAKK